MNSKKDECVWTWMSPGSGIIGWYETSCGEMFNDVALFYGMKNVRKGFEFCPYCGKEIYDTGKNGLKN